MQSEVTATVTIIYGGLKATQYFSKWTVESEKVLKQDITRFRMPVPSRSSIKLVRFGCVEFSWVLTTSHPLLKSLTSFLHPSDPGWIEEQNALKKELFVTGLSLRVFRGSRDQPSLKRANPNADIHYPTPSAGTSSSAVYASSSPLARAIKKQKLDHPDSDSVARNSPNHYATAPAVQRPALDHTGPPRPPTVPAPLITTSTSAHSESIPPIKAAAMETGITTTSTNPGPSSTPVRNLRDPILAHFSSQPEKLTYCTRSAIGDLLFSLKPVNNESVRITHAEAYLLIEQQGDGAWVTRKTLKNGRIAFELHATGVNPPASAPPTSNTVPQKAQLSAPPASAPPTTNIARPQNNYVAAPAVQRSPPDPTEPRLSNIPAPLLATSTFAQPVHIPPVMTAAMEAQITAMLSNPAPSPTVVRNVRNFILTHFSSHPERPVYYTRVETGHLLFSNTPASNNSVLRTYAQACRLIEQRGDFTQVSRTPLEDGGTALTLGEKAVNPPASAPPTSNTVPQKAQLSAPPASAPPVTRHQISTQVNRNVLSAPHTPIAPASIGHSRVSTASVASNPVRQNTIVLGSANHAHHPQVPSASASPTSSVTSRDATTKSPSHNAQSTDDAVPLATALPPRHTKMGNGEVSHIPLQINTSRLASPTQRQPTSNSHVTPAVQQQQQQCISTTTTPSTATVAYAPDPHAPATTSASPLEKQYEKESQAVPQPIEYAAVAAHERVHSALTEQTAIPMVEPLDSDHDSGSSNMTISSPPAEAEQTMASVPAAQPTNSLTLRASQSPAAAQSPPINSSPEEPSMTSLATTNSERLSRVEMFQNELVSIQDRGRAVVSQLQHLGVTPDIDVRFAVIADCDRVAALEEQVKKIQLELDEERKQIQEQRRMLEEGAKLIEEGRKLVEAAQSRTEEEQKIAAEERRRRLEAENALADVERECRAPFVVPALLDAFMSVSKLTTRVIKTKGE
ncbi:hypothetical protein BDQ12DRAFT_687089 [Crucibulum laeve]|uniref:Uncharacterized protein n=1 Tax=Crucibulum laeve TaxID=68775 RepID=A0A5C3M543_9AGAR|nr:hypothetical protein BDQ12DRAFT_687089 [Crucibulum laeve]